MDYVSKWVVKCNSIGMPAIADNSTLYFTEEKTWSPWIGDVKTLDEYKDADNCINYDVDKNNVHLVDIRADSIKVREG